MFKKIKIQIENICSENDKALIETEIDVLEGVNKETAAEAKQKLTAAGGTVELQ